MTDEPTSLFAKAKGLHQGGQLAEAIALYSRAVTLRPDYVEAHNNLGNALGEAKRFEEAVVSLRRAAALRPDLAPIHSNLGLALGKLRRFEEAAASHRRAVDLQPKLAPTHNNLAMTLKELGRLDEAIVHYRRAIALKPDVAEFHYNLGNALKDLRQFEPALAAYRSAIDLRGDFAAAQCNLGNVLMELDRPQEAAASFRRAIEIAPTFAPAHGYLGDTLRALERFAEAVECYDRALALDPGLATVHNNRGAALLEMGRLVQARESFDTAIAVSPNLATAYFNRVRSAPAETSDRDVVAIEAMIAGHAGEAPIERAWLHFALGTAHEARGRFEEAFANFQAANRLWRGSIDFDEKALRDRFERTQRTFTGPMLDRPAGGGSDSKLPIFVLGMARSGSTLVEQILASHPEVHGAGERPNFDKLLAAVRLPDGSPAQFPQSASALRAADFRLLGDAYVGQLRTHHPSAARITDKNLANILNVGLIRLALPHARILHVTREPMDVCVSAYCLPFLGNAQPYSYELGELGRHYRRYGELMEHWRRVLPADGMLEVRYEDLVEDMEAGVRRILDYCGLAWDQRCLAFHETDRPVRTASALQVRQAIYRTSVGRWRRFQAHLGPLIEALGPYAPPAPDRPGPNRLKT